MKGVELSVMVALGAGLLSFLSPCVLPLVPSYLSFIAGVSFDDFKRTHSDSKLLRKVVLNSLLFIVGFSTVFMTLGLSFSLVGQVLISGHQEAIRMVAGLLIAFGVYISGALAHLAKVADIAEKQWGEQPVLGLIPIICRPLLVGLSDAQPAIPHRQSTGRLCGSNTGRVLFCGRLDPMRGADSGCHSGAGQFNRPHLHGPPIAWRLFGRTWYSISAECRRHQLLLSSANLNATSNSSMSGGLLLILVGTDLHGLPTVLNSIAIQFTPAWLGTSVRFHPSANPRCVCAPVMQALTASVRGYICARYVMVLWIHGVREVRMSGSASEGGSGAHAGQNYQVARW